MLLTALAPTLIAPLLLMNTLPGLGEVEPIGATVIELTCVFKGELAEPAPGPLETIARALPINVPDV